MKKSLARLKRLQRRVSRRKQGSANRQKAVQQLAKAHYRVANIRKDNLHQATTWLARNKSAIVLEDLHVNGMLKNHHIAQAIADVGSCNTRASGVAAKSFWQTASFLLQSGVLGVAQSKIASA